MWLLHQASHHYVCAHNKIQVQFEDRESFNKYSRRQRTKLVSSLGSKSLFGSSLGEDYLKATRFHHWIAKDPTSIGVICNLEWDYDDGSTSRVSQHVPDHRIKENERHHLAVAWSRLRAWRHRELLYAKDLASNDLDKRIYWPVTIN